MTASSSPAEPAEARTASPGGTQHETLATRELVRMLRVPRTEGDVLPESALWHAYIELDRRGEAGAGAAFVTALKGLHRQRSFARSEMAAVDPFPEEHRLAADPYLAELWKSYKRCICSNRNGPAGQLLRELEKQVR